MSSTIFSDPVIEILRFIALLIDEGKNIQTAIAGLGGTSVANLEPVKNNATVKTIAGITKLSYFEWPITGDYADIESFSLTNGWALRNNQKYGKKGSGKHITATVKLTLRDISCQKMQTKQIVYDVPEIKTVEGWIARFLSSLRKEYAVQRIAENNNNISGNRQNEILNQVIQPYNNNDINNTNSGHNTQETRGIRNKRLWCEEEKKVCNNIKRQKKITLASKTC
ncbi:unnamed protein product [Rhizophagus irregularis]|nr:unnamed protein product [Rhizophagus irregularis]